MCVCVAFHCTSIIAQSLVVTRGMCKKIVSRLERVCD